MPHRLDAVNQPNVQDLGQEPRSDAHDFVRPRVAAAYDRRLCGLHRHHLDAGLLLLEEPAGASEGAAGAHPSNKDVDLALAVLPNFGAGGAVVGLEHRGGEAEGGSATVLSPSRCWVKLTAGFSALSN